jgi:hypothetical protein
VKRLVAAGVLLLTACAPQAPKADDPLAPARDGKIICLLPAASEKLCNTMVRLEFGADGVATVHSEVLMPIQPTSFVMSVSYPATIKDGAFCGTVRPSHLDTAAFTKRGEAIESAEAESIRAQLKANMVARNIGEACLTPVLQAGGYSLQTTEDGVAQPDLSAPMTWIEADAGYAVTE